MIFLSFTYHLPLASPQTLPQDSLRLNRQMNLVGNQHRSLPVRLLNLLDSRRVSQQRNLPDSPPHNLQDNPHHNPQDNPLHNPRLNLLHNLL